MSSPSVESALGPDDFIDVFMAQGRLPSRAPVPGNHGGHHRPQNPSKEFYDEWFESSSSPHSDSLLIIADNLRKLHPKHSLVISQAFNGDVLNFPGADFRPLEKVPLVTDVYYVPIPRSAGTVPGILLDQLLFSAFQGTALGNEYLVYHIAIPGAFGPQPFFFILNDGPEEVGRLLVLSAGAFKNELHQEIWVFDQGWWHKDHELWVEAQKASWDDVILKDEFKKALQKDVYGFFASRDIYKDLQIPWKRGLIMHGPPGNGKTISLKTIIKTCDEKGFCPLYVKSFQSYMGEEGAMNMVFNKAREMAPCVLILEDLDSLINDRNRSFFLNQLDGLQGNDGLLIIGTTNHFDRLDPGLSTRPSRFDRKYLFDDPDEEERKLYVRYWQNKLKNNKEIDFPDTMVDDVAKATDKFSFAYLKEAFVSSLVTYAGIEGDKPAFSEILFQTIETLRGQLDKQFYSSWSTRHPYEPMTRPATSDSHYQPQRQSGPGAGKKPQGPDSVSTSEQLRLFFERLAVGASPNPAQNKVFVSPSTMQQRPGMPPQHAYAAGNKAPGFL